LKKYNRAGQGRSRTGIDGSSFEKRWGEEGAGASSKLGSEQSLLAGVLVDPESMNKVVDILLPEDFYRDDHARVFELMLRSLREE